VEESLEYFIGFHGGFGISDAAQNIFENQYRSRVKKPGPEDQVFQSKNKEYNKF
jgi:hypothetical protein